MVTKTSLLLCVDNECVHVVFLLNPLPCSAEREATARGLKECSRRVFSVTFECVSTGHVAEDKNAVALSELCIQLLFALFPTALVHVQNGSLPQRTLLVHVYTPLFKSSLQNLGQRAPSALSTAHTASASCFCVAVTK